MSAPIFYVALIHKDADSDYGVSFPDFQGCASAGSSWEEALSMGREAIEGHIALMIDEGEAIPEPSTVDAVMSDPENRDGAVAMIPVSPSVLHKAKAVRVTITMAEDTLKAVDQFAEAHGYTRSGFLARAAKREMADA